MAVGTTLTNNKISIEIEASELSSHQMRLMRTINSLMMHVLKSEDEEQYFEGSAELMRVVASLISQAQFNEQSKFSDIPYDIQAVEYAMDVVLEYVEKKKVISYDN